MFKKKENTRVRSLLLFMLPALLFYLMFYIYPISKLFSDSLFQFDKLRINKEFVGISNYIDVFSDPVFYESTGVTIRYTIFSVLFSFLIGFLIALSLQRGFRGDRLIRSLFLTPLMLAPVVSGLVWRFMLSSQFGILNQLLYRIGIIPSPEALLWLSDKTNAFVACVIANVWASLPFFIITLIAGLKGVPRDMLEAAEIDGAGVFSRFLWVTLPYMKNVIITIVLLKTIDSIRGFGNIWVLTEGGPGSSTQTLSIYLYKNMVRFNKVGYASAMAVVFMILIMIFAAVFMRYLMEKKEGK